MLPPRVARRFAVFFACISWESTATFGSPLPGRPSFSTTRVSGAVLHPELLACPPSCNQPAERDQRHRAGNFENTTARVQVSMEAMGAYRRPCGPGSFAANRRPNDTPALMWMPLPGSTALSASIMIATVYSRLAVCVLAADESRRHPLADTTPWLFQGELDHVGVASRRYLGLHDGRFPAVLFLEELLVHQ
jgi:hypothetical protein